MPTFIRSWVSGVIASAGLMSCVPASLAQTVTLNLNSPFQFGNGGEFVATPSGFPAAPVSLTSDGNFQTFCTQTKVEFSPGGTYSVYFAPAGAPGGPVLNEPTAFLYDQFIHGVLPGYDFTNTLNLRQNDAGALQYAIWTLEGQDTSGLTADPDPALTGTFIAYATANAVSGNFYGVSIMVMYSGDISSPTYAQNQLIEFPGGGIPAPATGTAAVLAMIVANRRRRAAFQG